MKMEEGTDFRDDQVRWQIIVKTPYQDLGDEWVARHRERMGQEWYELSALQQIIPLSFQCHSDS
ncbi:MAG: helicase C-terminal domain-containing protein [Thermoplasmata archaeon]